MTLKLSDLKKEMQTNNPTSNKSVNPRYSTLCSETFIATGTQLNLKGSNDLSNAAFSNDI